MLVRVFTCQNAILLEISCTGSLLYNLAQLKRVLHFQHLSDQCYHIRKQLLIIWLHAVFHSIRIPVFSIFLRLL